MKGCSDKNALNVHMKQSNLLETTKRMLLLDVTRLS